MRPSKKGTGPTVLSLSSSELTFDCKLSRQIMLSEPRRHLARRRQLHHAQAADLRVRPHLRKRLLRRRAVEVQHRDRLAAGLLPADGHLGDVHAVLAEDRADEADQPRHVAVA